MRALAFTEFGGPLTVIDLPVPAAPPGGAVVAVEATGLCRSDWHAWMGHDTDVQRFPHVPGHEFAGVVTEVGDGVDRAWVGRRVTAPFVQACGRCEECRRGDGQVCPNQVQPGFTRQGSFAEHVVVAAAETNLVALPDDLDASAAAALGCRVATAYRAVRQRARVTRGETVLVLGCGGVGLAAVAIAAAAGARVIAIDVSAEALTRAARLGSDRNLRWHEDLPSEIAELTGGVHVALDCLGSPATAVAGIRALRPRGRHVQVGLLPPAAGRADLPMELVIGRELDVLGSHGMAARDYPQLLADVAAGLDLGALLAAGPTLGLAEAADALPAMGVAATGGIRVLDPRR